MLFYGILQQSLTCFQRRPYSVFGKFEYKYVCWLCDILCGWLHGPRTAKASVGGSGLGTGVGVPGLPFSSFATTRFSYLVLLVLLYATSDRFGFTGKTCSFLIQLLVTTT